MLDGQAREPVDSHCNSNHPSNVKYSSICSQRPLQREDREEGELSPEDEQGKPSSSNPVVSINLNSFAGKNQTRPGNQSVTGVSANVISQMPRCLNPGSIFFKDRVPLKSANTWKLRPPGPFKNDDNLVIRFSDDECDSKTEEYRKEKRQKVVRSDNQLMGSHSTQNSLKFQQREKILKPNAKNFSMTRKFSSSSVKNERANACFPGASANENISQTRNSNSTVRGFEVPEHNMNQGVSVKMNRLQDLRQQIAQREQDMKLLARQISKECAPVSVKDIHVRSMPQDASEEARATKDVGQILTGTERKRLILSIHDSKLSSDGVEKETDPVSVTQLREQLPETAGYKGTNDFKENKVLERKQRTFVDNLKKLNGEISNDSEIQGANLDSDRSCVLDYPYFSHTPELDNTAKKFCLERNPSVSGVSYMPFSDLKMENMNGNLDMEAIIKAEDSLDKELGAAQEFRLKCEIEERNALRAYRAAQKALILANARCQELRRRREVFSIHLGSILINDLNPLWSSPLHTSDVIGVGSTNFTFGGLNPPPMSKHQLQPELDVSNHFDYASVQHGDQTEITEQVTTKKLDVDRCTKPDSGYSEQRHEKSGAANVLQSPSCDADSLAYEDEGAFPLALEKDQENAKNYYRNEGHTVSEESLILEAQLRTELCARLRVENASKNTADPVAKASQLGLANAYISDRSLANGNGILFSGTGENEGFHSAGEHGLGRSNVDEQVEIKEGKSDKCFHAADDRDKFRKSNEILFVVLPSFELKCALSNMSFVNVSFLESQFNSYKNGEISECGDEEVIRSVLASTIPSESLKDAYVNDSGSMTCPIAIDPFWPLCMYELRGRCNNEKCGWQHIKSSSCGNTNRNGNIKATGSLLDRQTPVRAPVLLNSQMKVSPTYMVGLDSLKAEMQLVESIFAWRNGFGWEKIFTTCLGLTNLVQKDYPADRFLYTRGNGLDEVNGDCSRPSLYFHDRSIVWNIQTKTSPSSMESLEMTLLVLLRQGNTYDGMKKALSLLSRALETEQTSEILWIVYLLIYYGRVESMPKEDMFSYAIKQFRGSYVLWLMFINSRTSLDDRLGAYDLGLQTIVKYCPKRDEICISASILDMLLQKLDCLCMSGNSQAAIATVSNFFSIATDSADSFFDIFSCLTISDQLVLWISYMYLVIYRKLPDAIVQQFECEKEVLDIDWPSVQLSYDEKKSATKLINEVVDYTRCHTFNGRTETETNLRVAHHFALSHIRCMAIIDCEYLYRNLLDEYLKLFPSCLELVLWSVRKQVNGDGNLTSEGFEKVLSKWPKQIAGINCIWNQYFEHSLRQGGHLSMKLMVRWFNSIIAEPELQSGQAGITNLHRSQRSLESASVANLESFLLGSNQMDITFGYLNFALAKLLLGDVIEARLSIDRALKSAGRVHIKHLVRELASALHSLGANADNDRIYKQLNILKSYLDEVWSLAIPDPISRKFVKSAGGPRVEQLVCNLLCPVSPDSSLLNSALEVLYGPSLVPETLIHSRDLVMYVETIMDIVPSNYQFALSVYKFLRSGYETKMSNPNSIRYWAKSILVTALFVGTPVAPEFVLVEASHYMGDIENSDSICETFFTKALTIYPFSLKLWTAYYNFHKTRGNAEAVAQAAKDKGITLA